MSDIAFLESVLEDVERRGLVRNPRRVPRGLHDDSIAIQGEVVLGDRNVTLRLTLDACFPLCLPRFSVRPPDALGELPHVDERGEICFADREGLLLDRRRPGDVVADALERALGVLARGLARQNLDDFADEFENYWDRRPDKVFVRSVLEPTGRLGWANVLSDKEGDAFVAWSESDVADYRNGATVGGAYSVQRALYLPFKAGTVIVPPLPPQPMWSAVTARRVILGALAEEDRARLSRMLRGRTRHREYVIACLPRPSGGHTLFGLRFEGVGRCHPLLPTGTAERVVPLALSRLDRGYLIPRGGGSNDLATKRVLLAGCGAVGGHLAFEMVRAGVLSLTLVDRDVLSPDNTFRHALGRRYWGHNKAEAIKADLEGDFPFVRVRAVAEGIETALASGEIELEGYDLVLVAIGDPTVELDLNERVHALPTAMPALFTWLEPYGIGGHALVTHNGIEGGCLECLYTPPVLDDGPLHNRAAFAASGQSFGRDLSGCGSLHTPYGSVDAVHTAALAGRLGIDVLSGRETGNPLVSWRGNAREFEEAGFRLSPRFNASEEELHAARYGYGSCRCPVCRGGCDDRSQTEIRKCRAA